MSAVTKPLTRDPVEHRELECWPTAETRRHNTQMMGVDREIAPDGRPRARYLSDAKLLALGTMPMSPGGQYVTHAFPMIRSRGRGP